MRHAILIILLVLLFPLSSRAELVNPLEGSLTDAGQFGNSEVKFYSGDLGLFVSLPSYPVYGESESLSFSYHSQTASPWVTLSANRFFYHAFDSVDVAVQFQNKFLLQSYEGLSPLPPSQPGYFFKAHFKANQLPTGFYSGRMIFNYTFFDGFSRFCSHIPFIGSWFGSIQHTTSDIPMKQFVLNSGNSAYGAGWHFALDQRLFISSIRQPYMVRIAGDGSYTYHEKQTE